MRILVKLENWGQFEVLYTRNISRGGMFIKMSDPAPPGTQLSLDVETPEGDEIELRGQVTHTVSPETAASRGSSAGVGVRFLTMTKKQVNAVHALLERAREVAAEGSSKLPARDAGSPEDVAQALREELGAFKERDYFEVLGIPRAASSEDVERGYLMQTKRWHPSAYKDVSDDVRELVAEIFIIIEHARNQLADPARRETMRRRTAGREQPDPEDLFAENAAPSTATAFTVELSLAQGLADEGKFSEARKLLSHALAADPDNWILREHYSLAAGHAALTDGDSEAAALHFEEAVRVNPNSEGAIQALRGMKHKRRKARGAVLARLFGRKKLD